MYTFYFIDFNHIFVLVNLNFETSYTYTSSTMNSESMHILRPATYFRRNHGHERFFEIWVSSTYRDISEFARKQRLGCYSVVNDALLYHFVHGSRVAVEVALWVPRRCFRLSLTGSWNEKHVFDNRYAENVEMVGLL